MSANSTLNQVMRYVYDDCSAQETAAFEGALMTNDRLYYLTAEVIDLQRKISQAKAEPSKQCLDNIMAYAKSRHQITEGESTQV